MIRDLDCSCPIWMKPGTATRSTRRTGEDVGAERFAGGRSGYCNTMMRRTCGLRRSDGVLPASSLYGIRQRLRRNPARSSAAASAASARSAAVLSSRVSPISTRWRLGGLLAAPGATIRTPTALTGGSTDGAGGFRTRPGHQYPSTPSAGHRVDEERRPPSSYLFVAEDAAPSPGRAPEARGSRSRSSGMSYPDDVGEGRPGWVRNTMRSFWCSDNVDMQSFASSRANSCHHCTGQCRRRQCRRTRPRGFRDGGTLRRSP